MAEVAGSNPVGCANDFNELHDSSQGSGLAYVRITLVVVAPFFGAHRIEYVIKIDNWKSRAIPGKIQKQFGDYWEVSLGVADSDSQSACYCAFP